MKESYESMSSTLGASRVMAAIRIRKKIKLSLVECRSQEEEIWRRHGADPKRTGEIINSSPDQLEIGSRPSEVLS